MGWITLVLLFGFCSSSVLFLYVMRIYLNSRCYIFKDVHADCLDVILEISIKQKRRPSQVLNSAVSWYQDILLHKKNGEKIIFTNAEHGKLSGNLLDKYI